MSYIPYTAAEQPINKQFLQMERHIFDSDVVGCVLTDVVVWEEDGYCQIFYVAEDIPRLHKDGERLLDHQQREKTIAEQQETITNYWKSASALLAAVQQKAPNPALGKPYDDYIYALRRVHAHFITSIEYALFAVEQRLRKLLAMHYHGSLDDVYTLLTTPTEKDLLLEEKEAWYHLIKSNRDISDTHILDHYRKHSIVLANVFSDEDVLKLAKERLSLQRPETLRKELEKSSEQRAALQARKQQILNKMNTRDHQQEIIQLAAFLCNASLLRLKLKSCWNGESFHLLPFFKKIAEQTPYSSRAVYMFLTHKEVSHFLHNARLLPIAILEQREAHCLLHYHDRIINVYNGEEAVVAKHSILDPSIPAQDVVSFTGSIASKGRVVGRARVVKVDNPHAINEIARTLSKDSILVTGMTNPTMMVLIEKIKGIITDEGGIACHAAIISREYGLPCIVGSRIATHVLHDGDCIELDANKGIVRKLSEQEYEMFIANSKEKS